AATNSPKTMKPIQPRARIRRVYAAQAQPAIEKSERLMGGESERSAVRPNLSRHQAFRPWPKPNKHRLARAQFSDTVAAQGLHVHEYIRCAFASGQKPETAQAVEPFDLGALETTGRCDRDVRTGRRHLRRMHRGTLVHRYNAERLQPLWTLQHLAD